MNWASPLSPMRTPFPDFESCHTCGADAAEWVYWADDADGWTCLKCGGTDADE